MAWYDIVEIICLMIVSIFAIIYLVMMIIAWKQPPKIMYVEDGSLDEDTIFELEMKGYTVVIYRAGSKIPEVQK